MTPAVNSGRSASSRSLRSLNLYISFCTTSLDSPEVRANSSKSSNIGVRTSP
jgi:hypothetical protein